MKPFTCSFRDRDGTEYGFELWADDHADAERRLARLKTNANVDGEIMARIPVPGFFERLFRK